MAPALPRILYGTAWKQERTAALVGQALRAGYRGFDTANQKKHYREDFAGEAIQASGVPRAELFLQSKFTFVDGQDHRLPYDPDAPYAEQVRQSFEGTLRHFGTDYLDSYLLHGPSSSYGLDDADWEVWEAMSALHREGRARLIGVSNVGGPHLKELHGAKLRPMLVQNRCYASRGWDRAVREYCLAHGILYQGFSLLTANPQVVGHPRVAEIARRLSLTPEQLTLRFSRELGIWPLTGTTDESHMRQDLAMLDVELPRADVETLLTL